MIDEYLKSFLDTLKLEGYSEGTIKIYCNVNKNMLTALNKLAIDVTTADIRSYLSNYKETHNISNSTLNNYQHYISSFYKWLHKENIIQINPCENLRSIKTPKTIKEPFTTEEMTIIRNTASTIRVKTLIEVLYSTGMRASELIALNRDDIDWENNKAIVFGKGRKEREVYFSLRAIKLLQRYLKTREDDNEALFVTAKKPARRMTVDSLESMLNSLGNKCGIHIYPHKFRHTCATNLLDKGMPIQEVSKILGHSRLETTMLYCKLNEKQIAEDYAKCMN